VRAARGVALALAALLFGCPPDKPPQNPKDAAKVSDAELPKDVDGLVKYADEQYGRHEQGAVFNAIKALEKAVELDAKSFEALWRLARTYSWLADTAASLGTSGVYAQKGMDYAQKAIAADGARVEGQYYLGVTIGQYAETDKVKGRPMVPQVLEAAKKAMTANEKFDHFGPLRLLGSLYAQAPEPPMSVGDHEEGIKILGRTVQMAGGYPLNHLLFAEGLRVTGDLDQAEREYRIVLSAADSPNYGPLLTKWKQSAEEGLKRVENLRRQKSAPDRGGF
jgi:tetratricopeptide (TPR) repeat protein